jgi:hypothetical protein
MKLPNSFAVVRSMSLLRQRLYRILRRVHASHRAQRQNTCHVRLRQGKDPYAVNLKREGSDLKQLTLISGWPRNCLEERPHWGDLCDYEPKSIWGIFQLVSTRRGNSLSVSIAYCSRRSPLTSPITSAGLTKATSSPAGKVEKANPFDGSQSNERNINQQCYR